MKVTCDRPALVETLAAVGRAASARGPIHVLSGIKVEALADRLVLSATDTEISLRATVPADVEVEGATVVPARTFVDLLRKLPSDRLTLESDSSAAVRVLSGRDSDYRLNTLSAADFPELPVADLASSIGFDRLAFFAAFESVARAVSRDSSRPVYTGVLVGADHGVLTMVATDGHRLAVQHSAVDASGELAPVLIPARAIAEASRLSVRDARIELSISENLAVFQLGGYRLTARRLNGQFQPFEPLLASAFAHEAFVDRGRLLDAVDRATVLVQRNSPVVLAFGRDSVALKVSTAEVGEATERMPLLQPGPEITVAFNPRYLLDGLQLIDGDEVRFKLNDELRPVVLQGATQGLTYLVAPVRRSG